MVLRIVLVSLVVMGMSQTIAKERIFEPLRARLGGKETWAGYLVSCPYCVSHWLAFGLVPLTGAYGLTIAPRWPIVAPILDWFLSSILIRRRDAGARAHPKARRAGDRGGRAPERALT